MSLSEHMTDSLIEQVRHPHDQCSWGERVGALAFQAMRKMMVKRLQMYLLANATVVGPDVHAHVWQEFVAACETLRITQEKRPMLYIVNNTSLGACAYLQDIIVLNSGLVERFPPTELKFVIGHELGHILCLQHSAGDTYRRMRNLMLTALLTDLASIPASSPWSTALAILGASSDTKFSLAHEFTADRVGYVAVGDVDVACRALIRLCSGGMRGDINVNAWRAQQLELAAMKARLPLTYSCSNVVRYGSGASHPHIAERVAALEMYAKSDEFAFSVVSAARTETFPCYRRGTTASRPRARYAADEPAADEAVRQRYEGFEIIDAAEAESDGQEDDDEPPAAPTIRLGFSEEDESDAFSEAGCEGQDEGATQFGMLKQYDERLETGLLACAVALAVAVATSAAVAFKVRGRLARS